MDSSNLPAQAAGVLFESVRPLDTGYYQADRVPRWPLLDFSAQAALVYVAAGAGEWTVGKWKFPVRSGDLLGVPCGSGAEAKLEPRPPLAFYYVLFDAGGLPPRTLTWPWKLGVDPEPTGEQAPCASAGFRPEVALLFRQLQQELRRKHPASRIAARANLALLGVTFGRMLAAQARRASGEKVHTSGWYSKAMPESFVQTMDFLENNLEKKFTLGDLARVASYSERRVVQLFRKFLGVSPMAFVRERRIREAQKLLAQGGFSIKEIAARLNFSDAQHFSRVFREVTGITPTDFAAGIQPVHQHETGTYLRTTNKSS